MKYDDLGEIYRCDGDGHQLFEAGFNYRMLLSKLMKLSRPEELLEFIVQYEEESVFPNLCIVIQVMLAAAT